MEDKQQPEAAPEQSQPPKPGGDVPTPTADPPAAATPAPAGEKPVARPAPKPAPPKAPAVMQAVPWEGEIPAALESQFGSDILRSATYRGQDFVEVTATIVPDLLRTLRDDRDYDYLAEETAVDYPNDEKRFELVYVLYSFSRNHRLRIKARLAEGVKMPSVVDLYSGANWMEREIFDMFGIEFSGHPDLRRILMPDEWEGHPLRKDYGIVQQDTRWVQENLEIESGQ